MIADKTKAALQSCQCHYEIFKQSQDITLIVAVNYRAKFCAQWAIASGQSLSGVHICILVGNSLISWQSVKLRSAHNPLNNKQTSNLRFGPNSLIFPFFLTLSTYGITTHVKTTDSWFKKGRNLPFNPNQLILSTPSLWFVDSRCEENRISLLMKFSKALESASKQNQQVKFTQLNIEDADSIQDFSSSFAFLRWRRLISPTAAVIRKPAVLSPLFFTDSISSNTSCGTLTFTCFDLLFTEPVAIAESPCVKCYSLYAKKTHNQYLTCYAPSNKVNSTLIESGYKNGNAPDCCSSTEASNHNVIGANTMACIQHTQTRPKYQYRFLALNRHDKKAKPCRLSVEAATEREARSILAPHFILSLAARLPVQEVRHV